VEVNVQQQSYSVFVGTEWNNLANIVSGIPFRAGADVIDRWNIRHTIDAISDGFMVVCDVSLSPPSLTTGQLESSTTTAVTTAGVDDEMISSASTSVAYLLVLLFIVAFTMA
jgi:hypothetical protein